MWTCPLFVKNKSTNSPSHQQQQSDEEKQQTRTSRERAHKRNILWINKPLKYGLKSEVKKILVFWLFMFNLYTTSEAQWGREGEKSWSGESAKLVEFSLLPCLLFCSIRASYDLYCHRSKPASTLNIQPHIGHTPKYTKRISTRYRKVRKKWNRAQVKSTDIFSGARRLSCRRNSIISRYTMR